MTIRTITTIEVRARLEDLARRYPDQLNPIDEEEGCQYLSATGARCLISQLFLEAYGVDLHPEEGNAVTGIDFTRYDLDVDDDVSELLGRVQQLADGSRADWPAVTWGEAVNLGLDSEDADAPTL